MRSFDPGLLLVGLLVLVAVSPLFPPGLPSIADAPIHLFRTMELVACWSDGVYYPRWAPNLAFGYGYPLFDFAPPLPYFFAGALHVLGLSLETSIKLLSVLCLAGYGLGMYLFAHNVLGRRAALVAAAAYIYTPFRFWETLLYGGNYPQILAIGLFPWVLWAFERIIVDGRARYIVAGALCYAALILSHNFHALVFSCLLVLFILIASNVPRSDHSRPPRGSDRFFPSILLRCRDILWKPKPVVALLLGLMLTAFFWAPALYDLQYTIAQQDYYLTRSDFRLRLLSLRDLLAPPVPLDRRLDNPYVPFSLGIIVAVLAALGVVYLLFASWRRTSSQPQRRETWGEVVHLAFFLFALLGASFLMLRPAAPLWENLPFLPYAEFPWRLMGIANLAAAFLAGGSVRLWEHRLGSDQARFGLRDVILAATLLGLIWGVAVYFYPTRPFQRWGTPALRDYIQYEVRTQNVGTTGLAEYLPRWATEIPVSSPLVGMMREGKPVEKLDRSTLPPGVEAAMLAHTATSDHYHLSSPAGFRAEFFTFYFPGWQAFLDGKPISVQIDPPFGLMAVEVPPGEHELLLRFGETPFRLAMDAISALGLVGLVIWSARGLVGSLTRRRREQPEGMLVADGLHAAFEALPAPGYGLLGLMLIVIFSAKVAWIDPYTTWFRRESPPNQIVGVQHPMSVRLEDNVLFQGYDLIGPEVLRPGQLLQVRLYWQATGPVSGDYISFIHLDAPPDNTTFATADNFHPGDPQSQNDVPTLNWNPALYVRDEQRLVLPREMLPIAYSLQAGLYERQTGRRLPILTGQPDTQTGDTIFLQRIHVLPPRSFKPLFIPSGQAYQLGESIQLLGSRLETGTSGAGLIQPGGAITVTLYWQALEPVENYTVFVHLLDAAGQVRAQHDSPPLNGRYPTHNWLPDQIVEDKISLPLATDLPPGEYRIAVGMYELASGQRLAVSSKGGDVLNGAILLEPALRSGTNSQ